MFTWRHWLKAVSCGLELTLILKRLGRTFLATWPNLTKTPSWEAQSGIHCGIEERVQKLNFSIVVEFFSKYVFSSFPNFCHGNYNSETIIYSPGTRISDHGSTITFIWVKGICVNDLPLSCHHCKAKTGLDVALASHASRQNSVFDNRNQFC